MKNLMEEINKSVPKFSIDDQIKQLDPLKGRGVNFDVGPQVSNIVNYLSEAAKEVYGRVAEDWAIVVYDEPLRYPVLSGSLHKGNSKILTLSPTTYSRYIKVKRSDIPEGATGYVPPQYLKEFAFIFNKLVDTKAVGPYIRKPMKILYLTSKEDDNCTHIHLTCTMFSPNHEGELNAMFDNGPYFVPEHVVGNSTEKVLG